MFFTIGKHDESVTAAKEALKIYNELRNFKEAEMLEGFLARIGRKEDFAEQSAFDRQQTVEDYVTHETELDANSEEEEYY